MAHKHPTPQEAETDAQTRRWESAIRADTFGMPDMGPGVEEAAPASPPPHCPTCGRFQGSPAHEEPKE